MAKSMYEKPVKKFMAQEYPIMFNCVSEFLKEYIGDADYFRAYLDYWEKEDKKKIAARGIKGCKRITCEACSHQYYATEIWSADVKDISENRCPYCGRYVSHCYIIGKP